MFTRKGTFHEKKGIQSFTLHPSHKRGQRSTAKRNIGLEYALQKKQRKIVVKIYHWSEDVKKYNFISRNNFQFGFLPI